MLVSDGDRESVVERLKTAFVEGRLTLEELRERTGQALAARTADHLHMALAGLPGASVAAPRAPLLQVGPARRRSWWPWLAVPVAGLLVLSAVPEHHGTFLVPFLFFGWFFFRPRRRPAGWRR